MASYQGEGQAFGGARQPDAREIRPALWRTAG
jgi:hypothetical protein